MVTNAKAFSNSSCNLKFSVVHVILRFYASPTFCRDVQTAQRWPTMLAQFARAFSGKDCIESDVVSIMAASNG